MSTEEHPISDNDENEAAREEHSFDELAKRLASKTISRRGALKLVGAALLSGVLGSLFTLPAGAQSNSGGGRSEEGVITAGIAAGITAVPKPAMAAATRAATVGRAPRTKPAVVVGALAKTAR